MAAHKGSDVEYFRKLAAATEYQIDFVLDKLAALKYRKAKPPKREAVGMEFYYPVLVVQGKILAISEDKGKTAVKSVKHVQLRYRLAQDDVALGKIGAGICHIDVVTESFFPDYVKLVTREMNTTARRLVKRQKEIKVLLAELPTGIYNRLKSGLSLRAAFALSAISGDKKDTVKSKKRRK